MFEIYAQQQQQQQFNLPGVSVKYTRVCVRARRMQSHVCPLSFLSCRCSRTSYAGSHMRRPPQACIKTPSTILHTLPAPCQCFALLRQPPPGLFKPRNFASKRHPASSARTHMDPFRTSDTDIVLQMGAAAPPPPKPRVCEKVGGGFSSLE